LDIRDTSPLFKLLDDLGGSPLIDGDKWNETNWSLNKFAKIYPKVYYYFYLFPMQNNEVKSIIYLMLLKPYICLKLKLAVIINEKLVTIPDDYLHELLINIVKDKNSIEEFMRKKQVFDHCMIFGECQYIGNT
jgi:hypothetical protein